MIGVGFLDALVGGVLGVAGLWFVFEIGVSWFKSSTRATSDERWD